MLTLLSLCFLLMCSESVHLRPEDVIVSLSIDSSSLEVQREAMRLLTSMQLFGGGLSDCPLFICLKHDVEDVTDTLEIQKRSKNLIEQIQFLDFEKIVITYSKSLPHPEYAYSLNKMCAFDVDIPLDHASRQQEWFNYFDDAKYLLYLDADIFVAHDPLPILSSYLPLQRQDDTYILCGMPFTTAHELIDFESFSGIPNNPFLNLTLFNPIPTLDGGFAYYGMCNTGIYFMEHNAAAKLSLMAKEYLNRAMHISPELPAMFMIDSFILWTAQQMLRFKVELFSLRLNFIVPAQDLYGKYLRQESIESGLIQPQEHLFATNNIHFPIALFHFSRGSDVSFIFESSYEEDCRIYLRPQSRNVTFVQRFFANIVEEHGNTICVAFAATLAPFIEYVTLRDDTATSYFRNDHTT